MACGQIYSLDAVPAFCRRALGRLNAAFTREASLAGLRCRCLPHGGRGTPPVRWPRRGPSGPWPLPDALIQSSLLGGIHLKQQCPRVFHLQLAMVTLRQVQSSLRSPQVRVTPVTSNWSRPQSISSPSGSGIVDGDPRSSAPSLWWSFIRLPKGLRSRMPLLSERRRLLSCGIPRSDAGS